jgi:hypothetical protein
MHTFTAFAGHRLIATGPITDVVRQTAAWPDEGGVPVLVFDDQVGTQIDFDLRGTPDEAVARLADHPWLQRYQPIDEKRSGPGRPKLGVVSREVSLLPRHWDWLNGQRGGASVTLRQLVEERMRQSQSTDRTRQALDAAAKFMWTMAGNLPDFEEASRALSRRDYARFDQAIGPWPADIRDHVRRLVATAIAAEQEVDHEPQR